MSGNEEFELGICAVTDELRAHGEYITFDETDVYLRCTGPELDRHTCQETIFFSELDLRKIHN